MKKLLDLIKKNYIAFTVLVVILLIILASVITLGIISHNRHKIVTKTGSERLYQYIGPMKNSFSGEITYEDDQITKITSERYNIINTILYYEGSQKAIIPFESSIVFYYRDNLTYYLPKYTTLELLNSSKTLSVKGIDTHPDNFIIYDGVDSYFLPDKSTLKLDGQEIKLSALSYVIANRATLTYYDYENDKLVTKENIKVANLKINNADIDLFNDVIVYNKKNHLIDNDIKKYSVYKED